MTGLRGKWVVLLAAVLATLLGCKNSTLVKGRCDKAADCSGGLTCDNLHTCVPTTLSTTPCSNNPQCGSDYACDNLQWCVCQVPNSNLSSSADPCSNGTLPPYRGTISDGGMGDRGTGDGGTGDGHGGTDAHDATPACQPGNACSGGVCSDAGVCVQCTSDSQCSTSTSPICDLTTNTCVACTSDAQCVAKLGADPGVCMFNTDGHCATAAEVLYVQHLTSSAECAAATGTVSQPFCAVSSALVALNTKSIIVLRGDMIPSDSVTNASPVSLIAQTATIRPGSGAPGLHVSGSDVYIRGLQIFGGPNTQVGLIADDAAMIRLDGLDIESMQQGGLLVTGGASYDVENSIFAANGGMRDSQNRQIGGAWIDLPTAGATARFAFNTVVSNSETGVECSDPSQVVDASLLARNLGGGTTPDYSGCTLASTSKALGATDPMLNATFRATPTSPCVDFVASPPPGAPAHDIDQVSRPQGKAFDCGASEYKAP